MHAALVRASVRVNASTRPLSRLANRARVALRSEPFPGASIDIGNRRNLAAASLRGRRALLLTAASFLVSLSPARAAVASEAITRDATAATHPNRKTKQEG